MKLKQQRELLGMEWTKATEQGMILTPPKHEDYTERVVQMCKMLKHH